MCHLPLIAHSFSRKERARSECFVYFLQKQVFSSEHRSLGQTKVFSELCFHVTFCSESRTNLFYFLHGLCKTESRNINRSRGSSVNSGTALEGSPKTSATGCRTFTKLLVYSFLHAIFTACDTAHFQKLPITTIILAFQPPSISFSIHS